MDLPIAKRLSHTILEELAFNLVAGHLPGGSVGVMGAFRIPSPTQHIGPGDVVWLVLIERLAPIKCFQCGQPRNRSIRERTRNGGIQGDDS